MEKLTLVYGMRLIADEEIAAVEHARDFDGRWSNAAGYYGHD